MTGCSSYIEKKDKRKNQGKAGKNKSGIKDTLPISLTICIFPSPSLDQHYWSLLTICSSYPHSRSADIDNFPLTLYRLHLLHLLELCF